MKGEDSSAFPIDAEIFALNIFLTLASSVKQRGAGACCFALPNLCNESHAVKQLQSDVRLPVREYIAIGFLPGGGPQFPAVPSQARCWTCPCGPVVECALVTGSVGFLRYAALS